MYSTFKNYTTEELEQKAEDAAKEAAETLREVEPLCDGQGRGRLILPLGLGRFNGDAEAPFLQFVDSEGKRYCCLLPIHGLKELHASIQEYLDAFDNETRH
ncbi:hypothetical protein [uncultured Parasutterella sp.]|jgi:hypothetical protein|uniref:hypothetical protein n=1 Tax=uncultured Parasutterella sp. TaxID=1263098 RepID=UPI00258E4CAC|nr:hypothetical protein [uncultured Parasutterella sp.]